MGARANDVTQGFAVALKMGSRLKEFKRLLLGEVVLVLELLLAFDEPCACGVRIGGTFEVGGGIHGDDIRARIGCRQGRHQA